MERYTYSHFKNEELMHRILALEQNKQNAIEKENASNEKDNAPLKSTETENDSIDQKKELKETKVTLVAETKQSLSPLVLQSPKKSLLPPTSLIPSIKLKPTQPKKKS